MAKKGRLISALDEHRNIDHKKERQKKLQKQAAKRKRSREHDQINISKRLMSGALPIEVDADRQRESEDGSDTGDPPTQGSPIKDAASTADVKPILETPRDVGVGKGIQAAQLGMPKTNGLLQQSAGEDEEDQVEDIPDDHVEEGIPLSDIESLSSEEKGDIVPHQRLTINNTTALTKAYDSIALPTSLPFSDHQSITSAEPVSIPEVNDDLNRELVFHQQCLTAAKEAREMLKKEGVPFSRPPDYFAEMIKSDEHMGRIKQKMTHEAANKKAAAEARKQRDLKKFGKQVQVAKLQERGKAKKETLDKINILKRKRKNTEVAGAEETDMFDVALEDATKADKGSRGTRTSEGGRGPNKRQKKDAKFGFGGKKRFAKSGDAVSSSDMRGFSAQKMKGQNKGASRLGKSRRAKRS